MEEIRYIQEPEYKVANIITLWLPKYFVPNFADFGAFLGCHLAYVAISLMKYVKRRVLINQLSPK